MCPSGILHLDHLVAPISQEHPPGFDLRIEPSGAMLYRTIRAARSAARSAERRISAMEEAKDAIRPNWKPVLDLAIQILSEESKDLEIVCYLIEALVRMHGFAGLHEGFRLCRILVERYWDALYPRPDEDGEATRIAPLMGLNGEGSEGTLIVPLLNIPLVSSASIGNLACSHHDQALALERIADPRTKARRVDQGAVSLKTFLEAVSDSPNAFYVALDQDIRGSLEEFQQLTELLDRLCGEHAPHSSNIKNALLHCHEVVWSVAGERIKLATTPVEGLDGLSRSSNGSVLATFESADLDAVDELDDSEPACPPLVGLAQGIPSRDHALLLLETIAAFFRKTEPHSPIPYTLEQAARWGRMSLPDLLAELIPDGNARQHYFRMVGIPAHPGTH